MIEVGRRKYKKGLNLIKQYIANGWEFKDELVDLAPLPWEKQLWMEESGENKQKFSNNRAFM